MYFRPPEIIDDIYPHMEILRSSADLNDRDRFDACLGSVINIIVSYDMGWSKRGNGRSYDSLNGYAAIIGYLSGKVLDYTTRNRQCIYCDAGKDKKDHDCRRNFEGSAKAMEADAGVELICKSLILREVGVKPGVVIGDEDSSLQVAIQKYLAKIKDGGKVHKLCDRNHLTKNFGKDLYALADIYKLLKKKGVIAHLKKLFKYAIAQNKGASVELRKTLESIPNHVFGLHKNCSQRWCKRQNDSSKQTITLVGNPLKSALTGLFNKYAQNSYKFSVAASSQSNESLNNMIAHKLPKNRCYSKTAASDYRVASAVLVKNEGEKCLLDLRTKLGLLPGEFTSTYARRYDNSRISRGNRAKKPEKKLQRIVLTDKRDKMKKKHETAEGTKYRSNMGMNCDDLQSALSEVKLNDGKSKLDYDLVYFNLSTSGLRSDGEILQIAAKCKDRVFSVFVKPTRAIRPNATSLRFSDGDLYVENKKVDALDLSSALQAFQQFLKKCSKSCILVAHNTKFHEAILIRAIVQQKLMSDFCMIEGFACSLLASKKKLLGRKGQGAFLLHTLANDFLYEKNEKTNSQAKVTNKNKLRVEKNEQKHSKSKVPNKQKSLDEKNEHPDSQTKVTNKNKSQVTTQLHDAMFDVIMLDKIVAKLKLKTAILDQFHSLKDSLNSITDKQKINSGLKHLTELKNVVSDSILMKMAQNGITFQLLYDTFTKEGENSMKCLLNQEGKNKKPLVTQREGVLEKLLDFMRKKTNNGKDDNETEN